MTSANELRRGKLASKLPQQLLSAITTVADRELSLGSTRLAERVSNVSRSYVKERESIASTSLHEALDARLRFFLPRDLPKVWLPLAELRDANALPARETLRVLDLGAGLGTTSLGARLFLEQPLDVIAVDQSSRALSLFAQLARELGDDEFRLETRCQDLAHPIEGEFDLILIGLALNELESDEGARAALLTRLLGSLSEDGSLIVIEPALREVTRSLQRTRDQLVAQGVTVFAPCVHSSPCPLLASERDWCHDEIDIALPDSLQPIARAAGLRFERLTFSYVTLRRDARTLADHAHRGTLFRVVSHRLESKGKTELHLCGAGERKLAMRLKRHREPCNAAFDDVRRGDLVDVGGDAHVKRVRVRDGVFFDPIPSAD